MSYTPGWLCGKTLPPRRRDFSSFGEIEFNDHKIRFAVSYCRGKDVLDLGCVEHNPENYKSRFWLHKALSEVANSLEGLDLYEEGVEYLKKLGFNVSFGNAENFELAKQFDVIVAGDLIEHLENLRGFMESCKVHLRCDGRLLISTPNPWYWRNIVKSIIFGEVKKNNPEHILWMCPVNLRQLAKRYNMRVERWEYGSRYLRDRIMPLPRALKHTSFHAALMVNNL